MPATTLRRRRLVAEMKASNEARCDRLLAAAGALEIGDLDWSSAGSIELPADVIATLVYMRDVEGFTDRDLVGLTAHRTTLGDPIIRRFLHVWRSEEAGHSAAIGRFLDEYGQQRGEAIPPRQLPPPAVVSRLERTVARIGGPVGTVVASAHMAWGAANELLTLNGYRLLAGRCGHPMLAELLRRIAAQEARHYSFYLLQAEWRLASSRLARTALRRVLSRAWTPVGVGEGYKRPSEFERVLTYLTSGREGQRLIERMDNRFSALPGFGDLRIFRQAAAAIAA
jgi:rubrerythrin